MPNESVQIEPNDRTPEKHRLIRPRLTIARSMMVVAVAAGLSVLARFSWSLAVCVLSTTVNVELGWLLFLGCRRRRRIVPRVHLAIIGIGLLVMLAGSYVGGITDALLYALVWITLVHPAILGPGLAWFSAGVQDSGMADWRVDLLVVNMLLWTMLVILPIYFAFLAWSIFQLFGGSING